MSQNSQRLYWSFEEVDRKLKDIMENIYRICRDTAAELGLPGLQYCNMNANVFTKFLQVIFKLGPMLPDLK